MNQIDLLVFQTKDAYHWTNALIAPIPHDAWYETPRVVKSNVAWQVGHLILSVYYHSIIVISGHKMEILKAIPMKEYSALFKNVSPSHEISKISVGELTEQLLFIQNESINSIRSLTSENLSDGLETSPMPHPVAKNKLEALDWNIKHTMWHCGQLALLRRIVHEQFDFNMPIEKGY